MSDGGAENGQAGGDDGGPRDFGKTWEDRRRRSRTGREAFQAARARAAGKNRDEIREIYLAERDARGLPRPSDAVLDAIVDHMSGNPLPAARVAAGSLVQMGKAIREISRIIRSGD